MRTLANNWFHYKTNWILINFLGRGGKTLYDAFDDNELWKDRTKMATLRQKNLYGYQGVVCKDYNRNLMNDVSIY